MALRFLAIAEQRSLFLSYVALLLSAVALTISISFSSAPPVAAQLRPELPPNYVRLEGLGTASLADRAVTAAKLADEAVTLRTLGTDALTEIASTVSRRCAATRRLARQTGGPASDSPRVCVVALHRACVSAARSEKLVGEVDEAGTTIRGHGFTSERLATGEYELTFDEAFLAPPVVLAVAQSYGVWCGARHAMRPRDDPRRSRCRASERTHRAPHPPSRTAATCHARRSAHGAYALNACPT